MKIILFSWLIFFSCQSNNKFQNTPKKFLNTSVVSKGAYQRDSLLIGKKIMDMIGKREKPFERSKLGIVGTNFIIDTITYSPNKQSMVILVLNKHMGKKLNSNEEIIDHIYIDGFAFLAKKKDTNIKIENIPIQTGNYENFKTCSKRLREIYFNELYTFGDMGYNYNINDIRFWSSPIWRNF